MSKDQYNATRFARGSILRAIGELPDIHKEAHRLLYLALNLVDDAISAFENNPVNDQAVYEHLREMRHSLRQSKSNPATSHDLP